VNKNPYYLSKNGTTFNKSDAKIFHNKKLNLQIHRIEGMSMPILRTEIAPIDISDLPFTVWVTWLISSVLSAQFKYQSITVLEFLS
jgi:hypothetical protein